METKENLDENPLDWMVCRTGAGRVLVGSFLSCARYCANQVPKRMTLDRLRILAALLVILMPRPLTYVLLYPIFRLVFGNLYPAYASYKAVRTKNVKEYVKWMMYWIVFALFTCAETFTDVFFSFWFPFYYEIKTILVVWLLSPATKGSSILYRRFVHPALIRREAEIDDALARATEQGYTAVLHLGTKGVNYATTVLMQTAIKHLTQSNPNELSDIATGSNQSGSGIFSSARPAPASKQLMETDQMDGYEMVNRSPRTNKDDFEPVDPVPSARNSTNSDDDDIDNDTDVTDDDSDEQLMEIEEENQLVFKVPSTKPTRRNQRSRKTSNCEKCDRVNTRKLRSHEKVFRYSDDDDFD